MKCAVVGREYSDPFLLSIALLITVHYKVIDISQCFSNAT
jgi:hypothetical protein